MNTENNNEKNYIFSDTLRENKHPILKKAGYKTKLEKNDVVIHRPTIESLKIPKNSDLNAIFERVFLKRMDLFFIMRFISEDITGEKSRLEIDGFYAAFFEENKHLPMVAGTEIYLDKILAYGIENEMIYFNGLKYYLSNMGAFFVKNTKIIEAK